MQAFDYTRPRSLAEASRLLVQFGRSASILAGGTSLIPALERQEHRPLLVMDVKGLAELRELSYRSDEGLRVGAATTVSHLITHSDVRKHYALLTDAAAHLGSVQIRNRVTVGGNVCTGSPASDLAPALLCYDAQCHFYGPEGERTIPLADFFVKPRETDLRPGELLVRLTLPPPLDPSFGVYNRLRLGNGGHITITGAAVRAMVVERGLWRWRIALASVAPRPLRATAAEALLDGAPPADAAIAYAVEAAVAETQPVDDVRASAAYRRAMVAVLLRRGIEAVAAQLGGVGR